MKNDLNKLVRWFCSKLTFNDLASVVPILLEVLSATLKIPLKPDEPRPPHYRDFRADGTPPLIQAPKPEPPSQDWAILIEQHLSDTGKFLKPVRRRSDSKPLPPGCYCRNCNAPQRYLYWNNGGRTSQVLCKVCQKTSHTDKPRRKSKATHWCPHCESALYLWKEQATCNILKCPSTSCSFYQKNKAALTAEEQQMRAEGKVSQFRLHYIFREFTFDPKSIPLERPQDAPVDFNRIHNNMTTVGLCLTYTISFGLSARLTANALERIHGIRLSHQTVINYTKTAATLLSDSVDKHMPVPNGTCAADETYIKVNGKTHYTWLLMDQSRAICGYNLSSTRGVEPALGMLVNAYGPPESPRVHATGLVADGLPSYDAAVVAYNAEAQKHLPDNTELITRYKVVGLKNLDQQSKEYRFFKQLIERLNRTYKYHTRPRAGFKKFDGAVALTTLFIAHYNFIRPHSHLNGRPPVELPILSGKRLYPEMWVELLRHAA